MLDLAIKAWESITTIVINRFMKADHNIDGTHKSWLDASNSASFSAAVDSCGPSGSQPCTLLIAKTILATANKTIHDHVTLIFLNRGKLSISSGKTITHNGPIVASPQQIIDGLGTLDLNTNEKVSGVYAEWWGTDGVDDAIPLQAALDAHSHLILLKKNYPTSVGLEPQAHGSIIGQGTAHSFITGVALGGEILNAPSNQSYLNGFTVDGDNVAGSIGINADDTFRPTRASWGIIRIINCKSWGFKFNLTSTGGNALYNTFRAITITSCTNGMQIKSDGAAVCNSWEIGFLRIEGATGNALEVDVAEGITITHANLENNGIAFKLIKTKSLRVVGGWLEGNTTDFDIANNPDVGGFYYGGMGDSGDITSKVTYVHSTNRSDLLTANNGFLKHMLGRWKYSHLEADADYGSGIITSPFLQNPRLYELTVTTGATIDVGSGSSKKTGSLFLNYSGALEITDLTNHSDGQLLLVVANNTNAYINDGGNFRLAGNWVPVNTGDNLLLLYHGSIGSWIEVSRSLN